MTTRRITGIVGAALAALAALVAGTIPGSAQWPAGSTNAVLSEIDADAGYVGVLRHWHGAGGDDVKVYPFTPYSWNSCAPGDGAILTLLTSPVGYPPPGLQSSAEYVAHYVNAIGQGISRGLQTLPQAQGNAQLQQIIAGMTTPGDPVYEALKVGVGTVNSLSAYEDYGYATFLFLKWEWRWLWPGCYGTVQTVPEGQGVPYVARTSGERAAHDGMRMRTRGHTAQSFRFP